MTLQKPNTSSAVEKSPSSETSLDTSKISLIQSFKKLHREQLEIFEETMSSLEETCLTEIKETLEKHVKKQMEDNFKTVRENCQSNIVNLLSLLLKQAENDQATIKSIVGWNWILSAFWLRVGIRRFKSSTESLETHIFTSIGYKMRDCSKHFHKPVGPFFKMRGY